MERSPPFSVLCILTETTWLPTLKKFGTMFDLLQIARPIFTLKERGKLLCFPYFNLSCLHTLCQILFLAFTYHTGQCKRTGGCYNELVVAFFSTSGGVKDEKKIYTCWLYYLFINLHLFYLWWHLAHRPPVTLQFMALPSNWWYNSWFVLQIQQSSGVLPWQVLFSSVTA